MASPADQALDDQSRFGEIVAILAVGCVASTLAVALRSWCRARILGTFGLDDAVMVIAQILTIATAVAEGLEAKYGLGKHIWTMPAVNVVPFMKSFYSSIVVYNVAVCLVKISILLQYRRIFPLPIIQRLTFYGIIFVSCWTVTLAFLLSLVCWPVAKFWDSTIDGVCLDQLAIWYVMAGVNLVTDFGIFSMPLPVVKSLQLPPRQKMMLMAVFALGFFTCVISIYRIHTLKVASTTQDPTWDNVDAATWSFLELIIGVLAACLPTLRPFLSRLVPRLFGSSDTRSTAHVPNSKYGSAYANHQRGYINVSSATKLPPSEGSSVARESLGSPLESRSRRGDVEHGLDDLSPSNRDAFGGAYSVHVVGGGGGRRSDLPMGPREVEDQSYGSDRPYGIKTTTVVSQRVEVKRG